MGTYTSMRHSALPTYPTLPVRWRAPRCAWEHTHPCGALRLAYLVPPCWRGGGTRLHLLAGWLQGGQGVFSIKLKKI